MAPEEPIAEKAPVSEIDRITSLHERTIAALSYISFLAIVPFYLKKDSEFCRFHGKQGMLLAIVFFLAKLLFVLDLLADIALILQFTIFIWMGLAALSGKWKKIPFLYETSCELERQISLTDEEAQKETPPPAQPQ